MKSLLAILGLLFVSLSRCSGQDEDYPFSKLDIRDGLSNNRVHAIYKDVKGFMWFATNSGLNRFDGYNFKVFKHNDLDSTSIIDDYNLRIYEGPEGKIWVRTLSDLNIFDPQTEQFDRHPETFLSSSGLPASGLLSIIKLKIGYCFIYPDSGVFVYEGIKKVRRLPGTVNRGTKDSSIADAAASPEGDLWLIHYKGLLEKFDVRQNKLIFRSDILQRQQPRPKFGKFSIFADQQNEVWLYQMGTASYGLYEYNPSLDSIVYFSKESARAPLSSNVINGLIQDSKGLIWVVTDHGGICIINKERLTVKYLSNIDDDSKSLPENSIDCIYKDDHGNLWLGTSKKGISYYDVDRTIFPLYHHKPFDPGSLGFDDVNSFVEDKKGNLWIGTNGGGIIYFDRLRKTFKQYKHEKGNNHSLCNDVVIGLCLDHNDKLWIGTYFGGMDCYDGKKFIHYRHQDSLSTSLTDDRVYHILEDKENNLWVGTYAGLDRFDRENNIFYHYNASIPYSIHSNNITSLTEDSHGNLWVGTSWGIDLMGKNMGTFSHLTDGNSKLSYDDVNAIYEDHAHNIWVATRRGLDVLQKGKGSFESFFTQDGLPDDYTLDILEDPSNNLWVSTKRGMSKISVSTDEGGKIGIHCTNYDEYDGLQGQEFNQSAALRTKEGELIFGGPNGFNLFGPNKIRANRYAPALVLTGFRLFNKNIEANDRINNHVVLKKAISEISDIELRYNENDFSLEFSALSFTSPEKNRYAYMLEGFNRDWVYADSKTRSATYTNIDPGDYVFRLKGSNNDGVWNEEGLRVRITIFPPFWKRPLAYLLYVILAISLLYIARKAIIRRAKMRFVLAEERREARRMHELDMMKIKFFTNVSHEFRTPLSLILTPVERLIRTSDDPRQKKQFSLIQRNAKRLLILVNQLLDFRKMEVNELKLNVTQGDIMGFAREAVHSFTDLAEKKNIRFSYAAEKERLVAYFDHDKTERIIFNLLSNAFKFTPEKGEIAVEVNQTERPEGAFLVIRVKDTGIGIEPGKQRQIFERFFQNKIPGSMLNQGSGIGLAITREFVEMSGGVIEVKSALNEGSCFTVTLPLKLAPPEEAVPEQGSVEEQDRPQSPNKKRPTVLLVEDNEDLRFYLKDNLREYFNIIEASNGKEGWQKTLSAHPDLIVSDVSMPVMNGIEFCDKIKTDQRTRHISFILLTAMTGEKQELDALETGPNDYITKPFNFEILLSKIRNLLAYQTAMKKTYQKQQEVNPSDIGSDIPDEDDFLKKALEIVERNMSDPDFSVESLAQELLLSRTGLYKKILACTGKTPIEFIRVMRLKRAAQFLEKTNQTVTEIAYAVGFNNPKYFARYFKEEFNILPSVYQMEKRKTPIQ